MKALTKEHLIEAINNNFKDNSMILENSNVLKTIWDKLGDEYFISNSKWECSKKANVDWDN